MAQQHDHAADAATPHSCACCGNSGSTAMNHAGTAMNHSDSGGTVMNHEPGTGCCTDMAASATAADHAAMNHDSAAQDTPDAAAA